RASLDGTAPCHASLMTTFETFLTVLLTGVGAALVASVATILVERRQHGYADRTRFIDLRRERYSQMLREADEHIRMLRRQHAAIVDWEANGAPPEARPDIELGSTDSLGHLAAEIALLGRRTAVGDAAEAMYQALVGLDEECAFDEAISDVGEWISRTEQILADGLVAYGAARDQFLTAAKADIGTI
ncbi:MAG: hypothetical protein ACHQ02_05920, partial [Candidatus Limnocylindrales bacterium]